MCLLFFTALDDPKPDGYRLVLANNRDESWVRPTKPANFWGPRQAFISGLDQQPGREGGTWLGMGTNGRLGCLLNVFGDLDLSKKGRGFLVNDFLSGSSSLREYLLTLKPAMQDYNGFHLVLLQMSKDSVEAGCITNHNTSEEECIRHLPNNVVHAFGNSAATSPWQKVLAGKTRFSQILERCPSVDQQEDLVNELLNMLEDRTQHQPDPCMVEVSRKLSMPDEITQQRTAMCVWSPSIQYGTRTTTVILVTADGKVHYYEKDLQTDPVNVDKPKYQIEHLQFPLHSNLG